MPFSRHATFDVLRSLVYSSISTTYSAVGTTFGHLVRAFRLVNNSNGDMFFAITNGSTPSSSGTADNFIVPAGTFVLWDVASDASVQTNAPPFCLPEGTQVWVRYSSSPSSGTVYVECLTASGE